MAGCVFLVWYAPDLQLSLDALDFKACDYIETEFSDIAQACQAMSADGWIVGERLITVGSKVAGELLIARRVKFAFRTSRVVALELPTHRLVDEVPGVTERARFSPW